MVRRVVMDRRVGDLRRGFERSDERHRLDRRTVSPPAPELLEDYLHGHLARDFTSRSAAHPVGHHEQCPTVAGALGPYVVEVERLAAREVSDDERVLVVLPR